MNSVTSSLARASHWLRSKQSPNGSWHDFWTPSGVSDEWVTAYVGAALALSSDARSQSSARTAWDYLTGVRREDGGWGYAAAVPSDSDSTAWALVLAERLEQNTSTVARDGLTWLKRACVAGGVTTYPDVSAIRAYVGALPSSEFRGWKAPHACVTAAAAQARSLSPLLTREICATQHKDGAWGSYWWSANAYATALSVTALRRSPCSESEAAVQRACGWARRLLEDEADLPAFMLSLLSLIFIADERFVTEASRCLRHLITSQRKDGRWNGSALLRIPSPDVLEPDRVLGWGRWWGFGAPFNVYSVDQCSVFTTATAYFALHVFSTLGCSVGAR